MLTFTALLFTVLGKLAASEARSSSPIKVKTPDLYSICVCVCCTQSCPTLCDPTDCSPTRLLSPWDFPGKNTIVGCHFLLQGIFATQGSNPCLLCLLHCLADSLPLYHLGSPWTCIDLGPNPNSAFDSLSDLGKARNLFSSLHFL